VGKIIALASFALIQCIIYLLIGNYVLEIRDMFLIHLCWMFITALTGACLGLLISSLVHDSRTALNIIPLLLIPQIILGGALIKYEEMNRNLDFVYSLRHYIKTSDDPGADSPSKLKVPLICHFMPLRWSYEAMLISQAKLNPLTHSQDMLERRIQKMVEVPGDLTETERHDLDITKQALAVISGLQSKDPDDVAKHLDTLRGESFAGTLTQSTIDFYQRERKGTSAEQLFVNKKVLDLVTKAEMEREDYRRKSSPNVFFGTVKTYPYYWWSREKSWHWEEVKFSTIWLNAGIILLLLALIIVGVAVSLRRQLTRV
jgi:hypothetical protein